MGVGVDEARRDDTPGGVDGARGLRPRQVPHARDAIAQDGDISAPTLSTRTVDHRAPREEGVVLLFCRHRRLPLSPVFAGGTMTRQAGRDNRVSSRPEGLVRYRPMQKGVRPIPSEALENEPTPEEGLGTALHELFKSLGGVELGLPPREPMREPPRFA